MNYIWSKKSLLEFIENSISQIAVEKDYSFADLFAWTHSVWSFFKEKWHKIIANDLQYYSYILWKNLIENNEDLKFLWLKSENISEKNIFEYLQNLEWKHWFIYKNYSLWGTKWQEFERMYFTDENAMKCDAIRLKIAEWKKEKRISEGEYFFLLASLLESIDRVANTASVYGAFLKNFKKSALKNLQLEPVKFAKNNYKNEVYNENINEFIKNRKFDIVYLDPPYNERQYSANYHILETIAKYDNPKIKWKTGLRDYWEQKSDYCKKWEVKKIFSELIKNIDAKYIFLSYNSDGLLSLDDIKEIMSIRGEYGFFKKEYKRFKADSSRKNNDKILYEYLHYVKIVNQKP